MTSADSTPPTQTPAGWYTDPSGEPRLRWWDGSAWTEHVSAPSTQSAGPAAVLRNTVPAETPTGNPFIWTLVLLPLVSPLLGLTIDYRSLGIDSLRAAGEGGSDVPLSMITGPSLIIGLIGWIVIAAIVALAYFDARRLRETGFERPFPWPWAFFAVISGVGVLVYVIGRTVVVRRRSGRGIAPLIVAIAVVIVGLVISGIHTSQIIGPMLDQIGSIDSGSIDS